MIDTLARNHRKVVTIIDPHIKGEANYSIFEKLQGSDSFVRTHNGSQYEGFCWPGHAFYPDFCSPKVRKSWAELFLPNVYQHSRPELWGWNDMNEPSVFNGPEISMPRDNLHRCHGDNFDTEHREVHNVYGFYHHQASVEGQLLRAPDSRPFVLTRSFFAGSQRHGPVWTGDNMARWDHLARSVPMLLTLSLCGLSFSGADVGGFMGDPEPELLARWHQLGIWYPFYRAHAHLTTKRREPWLLAASDTALVRSAVLTRYRLLPTWYTLLAEWALRGLPVLRPIWYHDLGDVQAFGHADDHFRVGDALLVRAITKRQPKSVQVYLPSGHWFDYWNELGAVREGPGAISLVPDPARVPVFVQAGHILLHRLRRRRSTGAMLADPYTVVVYGSPARGRVYIDDGMSYAFSKDNAFIYDELHFNGSSLWAEPAPRTADFQLTGSQSAPAVPASGLRIERIVFVGLPQRPLDVWLSGVKDSRRPLQVSAEEAGATASGTAWRAVVKIAPATVSFGSPHRWMIELAF